MSLEGRVDSCRTLGFPVARHLEARTVRKRRRGFDRRPFHVARTVNKMSLGQVFHQVLRFSPLVIILLVIYTPVLFMYHRRSVILESDNVVKFLLLSPNAGSKLA